MQGPQGVGGVAVAVLGGTQPPDGSALLVARVTQQEAEGAGRPGLTVLGGGEVPAAGLLELPALFQDGAEVQGGTAVPPGRGLAEPLLGLADASGVRARDGTVRLQPAHRRPAPALLAHDDTAQAEGVVRVADGVALDRPRQAVGGFPVPLFGGGTQPALGAAVPAVLQQVGERVRAQRVALLRGLAQPVLGAGLVAALAEVTPERVRGGGGAA